MAARLDQLAGDLLVVLEDPDHGSKPLRHARAPRGLREREAQCGAEQAVDELEVVLEGAIVRQEEFADARGVRRAAEVL